ncbi:MAG: KEOPS complex subunit Cgi121 [Candidatus Hydrothermarchaeota archaeon]
MRVYFKKIPLSESRELVDMGITLIDANTVLDPLQVEFAIEHAKRAFDEKRNISRSLSLEILIRFSGTRQIEKAIQNFGVKDEEVCIISDNEDNEKLIEKYPDFDLKITEEKLIKILKLYEIPLKEVLMLGKNFESRKKVALKLILEKISLLTFE